MKKAIVTGGAGFIGSNLVDKLLDNNYKVVVIDNFETGKEENLKKAKNNNNLTVEHIDITNRTRLFNVANKSFKDADCLFHLAALPRVDPSISDPIKYNKTNVGGTVNVFTACMSHGIKNIVYSSSSAIYGDAVNKPTKENEPTNPMSPYALQKLVGEQYADLFCKLYNMNITSLRYFNVYGKRAPTEGAYVPVIGIWLRQHKNNKPLTITGNGEQTRDFINVVDVVNANIVCAENNLEGHNVFNVGTGKSYSMNQIVKCISNNVQYIPPRIEPKHTLADIEKIKKQTGWEPKELLNLYIEDKILK